MEKIIGFDDICTPAQFEEECPHLSGESAPRMSYLMRIRHLNGLAACGAVIEPVGRRLMIVKPKYLEWWIGRFE